MTLDEAIKHCKEKAKELRIEAEQVRDIGEVISNPKQPYNKPVKNCLECAKEHEQLAEWLEELVELRSQRASECEWCKGCKEHDEENHCCHRLSNFIHTQAKEIHDMAYEEGKNDRPKGEWIVSGYIDTCRGYVAKCSCCKEDTVGGGNFCPNCGTKMRGGEKQMDYSYDEIIKDLEEVKMMFAEESDGNYPECLDYAMQAIEFISKHCPKSFESYIKGEEE